jgi:hypothetical protein
MQCVVMYCNLLYLNVMQYYLIKTYMEVSKNGGTPTSSIPKKDSQKNHPAIE